MSKEIDTGEKHKFIKDILKTVGKVFIAILGIGLFKELIEYKIAKLKGVKQTPSLR